MGNNTRTFNKDFRDAKASRSISKPRDIIYDPMGQWKYPGQVTKIPGNQITMQGVPYPVYGEDDLGYSQMMYPGMDYTFPGNNVTEVPVVMYGGDPSLPNIEGHYPFGGQYTKTHTHMPTGGWVDKGFTWGNDALRKPSTAISWKNSRDANPNQSLLDVLNSPEPDRRMSGPMYIQNGDRSINLNLPQFQEDNRGHIHFHGNPFHKYFGVDYGNKNFNVGSVIDFHDKKPHFNFNFALRKNFKNGGWLDEYAPGGEGPPSTLDIIKRRKQEQAIAEEAARRKGMVALPDISRVNVPDKKVVESKIKNEGRYVDVKGKKIPIKPQAQLSKSNKTEEQRLADEARGNYIENPTVMDYLGQAGYMPLLAMSDPFSMGEKLKSLRQSQSDPRLSAAEKFSQGMDIANEAVPGALLNVATEGIGEGLLPGVVNKFTKAPQMMKNLYKDIPLAPTAPGANAEPVSMVMPSKEKIKDLYGFLDRRRFLKELQKEGLVGNKFNTGDLNYAAGSTDKTNALTKLALDRYHGGFRLTSGKLPPGGKGRQQYTGNFYDMSRPAYGQKISEFENMTNAGVDFSDPRSIAEYQASHIPMEDYGYRSTGEHPTHKYGFIFNSPSPYIRPDLDYGTFQFKRIPKTNYDQGNYLDWYNNFYKNQEYHGVSGRPRSESIADYVVVPWRQDNAATLVGPRGVKAYEIDKSFPFTDMTNLTSSQKEELKKYVEDYQKKYLTGWRGEYKTGGWLDEEYKRGGALKKLPKGSTSKNIKTSVNKLMARNTTLYGEGGKKYYEPNVKPYYKSGGWLDDVK